MNDGLNLQDLVHRALPDHRVVSTSKPEPRLDAFNVLAIYRSADEARNAVLALAELEADDAAIGLTVLEPPGAVPTRPTGVDPEGVMRDIGPRTVEGAVIGAILGAAVIGLASALLASEIWIGGALGGALMGAAFGAVWGAFLRMGGGSAYRQTFVTASDEALSLVSLHTADRDEAQDGHARLAIQAVQTPMVLRLGDGVLRVDDSWT